MAKLLTIGETMACFVPARSGRLRYVSDYRMCIAGAESNVAIGMAKLGHSASWISALGQDEFGEFVLRMIRSEGVDTKHVRMDEHAPTGLMFKEIGGTETTVRYYRKGSAAAGLRPEDVSESSFADTNLLHLTGITPVLSESCAETVEAAISIAKKKGIPFSFDPNIRFKLWGDRDYRPLIKKFTLQAEIVLLGLDEAEVLFGTRSPEEVRDIVFAQGCATTLAIKNGKHGAWVADTGELILLEPYPAKRVEPIGAGDAFNAGFLTGFLEGKGAVECGEIGNFCGAMAVQVEGDIEGLPSRDEMIAKMQGKETVYR